MNELKQLQQENWELKLELAEMVGRIKGLEHIIELQNRRLTVSNKLTDKEKLEKARDAVKEKEMWDGI